MHRQTAPMSIGRRAQIWARVVEWGQEGIPVMGAVRAHGVEGLRRLAAVLVRLRHMEGVRRSMELLHRMAKVDGSGAEALSLNEMTKETCIIMHEQGVHGPGGKCLTYLESQQIEENDNYKQHAHVCTSVILCHLILAALCILYELIISRPSLLTLMYKYKR
jgi:hypothetical protein